VSYQEGELAMPPDGKLPDHEIAALAQWVRRGLPYPGRHEVPTSKTPIDISRGRAFWSFQPLRRASLPAVKQASWPQQRIDHFLLAEMERRGLAPAPPAGPRELLRRLYFDLVGLPPTPHEVDEFVAAWEADLRQRPALLAATVDRLLASPHYGERWARYWLDLVRYSDILEPWAEVKSPSYHYRDWVVAALNNDEPYDQFVVKQLAADLLPDHRPEDRAALGFLGLSPTYWKELKLAPEVIKTVVAEEWEERIHTVTSTFLGLTVSCARCHDHKYDPISMHDYYALAGVMASTRLVDRPIVPDDVAQAVAEARRRVAALEAQVKKLQESKPKDHDRQIAALRAEMAKIQQSTPRYDSALAPAVEDAALFVLPDGEHRTRLEYKPMALDVAMHIRGSVTNLGPTVPRRFLAVLAHPAARPFGPGSGRLELARSIVSDAAPLTARVMVNRVWRHHFGRGLVETPSDFGAQGDRPTHPELLDDLAARFIDHGWSLKWLHRELVLSAAYQQSSLAASLSPARSEGVLDPDNKYLARMARRRLDVEVWRDAMLAVAGTLDRRLGGPAADLSDPGNRRRTLYGIVKRRELHDLLRLHDFPDPTTHSGARQPTTTPAQMLFTLNSPFVQQQAAALAARLRAEAPASVEDRIRLAYRLLYARPPTDQQVALGVEFLTPPSDEAWLQYAQVLLSANEFLFVD
ncbi:MAG: DUF1549 and DUF1553 domain-containing protein, partial [Gemmataceae bacterium]|nr:DUF1549 and DUF1553 domain-containing protein [Gemmataceae bacterium]